MLYHLDSSGPDIDGFKKAFTYCYNLASNSNKEFKIAVHTKSQLKNNVIVDALGEKFVKAELDRYEDRRGGYTRRRKGGAWQ